MSAKFLESVGSKLAERWVATLLAPAFMFYVGGAIAAIKYFTWPGINSWFETLDDPSKIACLIAAFCLVATSAFIVQRFDLSILRFLEGYWYRWIIPLRFVRRWLIKKRQTERSRFAIAGKVSAPRTPSPPRPSSSMNSFSLTGSNSICPYPIK